MTTISKIRRSNLLRLRKHTEEKFFQDPKNKGVRYTDIIFCKRCNISTSTFSQLKNIKQKPYFNEVYVRNIEKHIGLELGWFDVNRDSTELKALRINYDQFRKGVLSYHDFTDADIITINDDKKTDHLLENLFQFLYSQTDVNINKITEADFFEFMK